MKYLHYCSWEYEIKEPRTGLFIVRNRDYDLLAEITLVFAYVTKRERLQLFDHSCGAAVCPTRYWLRFRFFCEGSTNKKGRFIIWGSNPAIPENYIPLRKITLYGPVIEPQTPYGLNLRG